MSDFIDDFFELLVTVGTVVILIIFVIAITAYGDSKDLKKWNNGHCDCGGHWEYQQAVGHRYDTDYIYKCDACGKIEEFERARDTQNDTSDSDEEWHVCPTCGYSDKGIKYCPKDGTMMR